MKKFITGFLALIMLLATTSMVFANEEGKSQKQVVGTYEVELITPELLTEGEQKIEVKLMQNGTAVEGAALKIKAEMDEEADSHSGMGEMEPIEKELETHEDAYASEIHFEGSGKWLLTVMINDKDKAVFEVEVASNGPNWIVVGGFIGLILLVIIVAALGRNKNKQQEGGISCEH